MLIGAGFWSVYADKCGRRSAFVQSLACVFLAGVASAAAPSLVTLCIFRMVVGFGVGGNLPVSAALVAEFLPTSQRAYVLCGISGAFWGVGVITASLLGLVLANTLRSGEEELFWRLFLGLAALPSAIVAVAHRVLPESPRFLHAMGKDGEAAQMLESVARMNGKLDVLGLDFSGDRNGGDGLQLESSPASGDGGAPGAAMWRDGGALPAVEYSHGEEAEKAEAGDVRELFHTPVLRKVTLCLYYGLTFLLPRYYDDISHGNKDFVYILSAFLGAFSIPGSYLAMWLVDEHRLGRVGGLKWSAGACATSILVLATTTRVTALFSAMSLLVLFCQAVPGAIIYLITPELYSTKYRAVGLGSCSVVTRLGGLAAPIIAEVMYDKGGPAAPLLVFGPTMIITAIAAGMIPIETAGRKLDDDSWDRR
eukprot:jgi/Undpi1/8921/HiC_scaffold_26.g11382.m1